MFWIGESRRNWSNGSSKRKLSCRIEGKVKDGGDRGAGPLGNARRGRRWPRYRTRSTTHGGVASGSPTQAPLKERNSRGMASNLQAPSLPVSGPRIASRRLSETRQVHKDPFRPLWPVPGIRVPFCTGEPPV